MMMLLEKWFSWIWWLDNDDNYTCLTRLFILFCSNETFFLSYVGSDEL